MCICLNVSFKIKVAEVILQVTQNGRVCRYKKWQRVFVKQKTDSGNPITYFSKGNYNNKNFTDPFPAGRGNIIESDIYSSFNLAPG